MTKISDLPLVGAITDNDQLFLNDPEAPPGQRTKKVTARMLATYSIGFVPAPPAPQFNQVVINQALYDALPAKDANTVYYII